MITFFSAMWLPFLACLLLTGIHVYLGIHVLARKVIFVDLALAQIAALGAVFGILLGFSNQEDPLVLKGFSLIFTIAGAFVFSLTKVRHEKVPQEALIGITYAAALAVTILFSSHLPHGADEVRSLLSGSILWVDSATIFQAGLLYFVIGLFHYIYRKQFFLISSNPEQAFQSGMNVRFWDFLFYLGFGFVVTSSVSIAGVLLVFSYLVIPAVMATLLADSVRDRLLLGWLIGLVVSFAGVWISYDQDLPSGPTIVVLFALSLVLLSLFLSVFRSNRPGLQLAKIALGLFLVTTLIRLSTCLSKTDHTDIQAMLSGPKGEQLMVLQVIGKDQALFEKHQDKLWQFAKDGDTDLRVEALEVFDRHWKNELLPLMHPYLFDENDNVREKVIRVLKKHLSSLSLPHLWNAFQTEEDDYLKVELGSCLLRLGDSRVIPKLIGIALGSNEKMVKDDALSILQSRIEFGEGKKTPDAKKLKIWWKNNRQRVRFDKDLEKYTLE